MGQDRAVQSDDVVALPHHHLPPILFKIILEFGPEWSVIPHPVESAINLARLEDEPAPFAHADNLLHPLRVLFPSHDRTYLTADHADETDFSINILWLEWLILVPAIAQVRSTFPASKLPLRRSCGVITGETIRHRQIILALCRI